MPSEKLDGLLESKLFSLHDLKAMKGEEWGYHGGSSVGGYPRWSLWGDAHPEQWACTPDNRIREHPLLSSTYEGMSRVIQKMIEKGFALNVTRESVVIFYDVDGRETRYAGDIAWGSSKPLPRIIAVAAILALEAADKGSLARWSLRGWLNGRAG
jgi:hypothetical protein